MTGLEEYKRIYGVMREKLKAGDDRQLLVDMAILARVIVEEYPEEIEYALGIIRDTQLKDRLLRAYAEKRRDELEERFWDLLLLEAPHRFESYMMYMEKDREPEKRFYLPRRSTLRVVAQDLQDLEDRKIENYTLSMPARVGKSTICIFFLSWIMGKRPGSHSAMGGHSNVLAEGFYEETLNLIKTQEYKFSEIFPEAPLTKKSAEYKEITLGAPDRFATLTCRGIEGTWTGAIDVSPDGYLYADDLVRDREESLSPERLEKRYQDYLNVMVDRMHQGARRITVATRWNVLDPIGHMKSEHGSDPLWRFREIPALNDEGESNFDYKYGVGFDTATFRQKRDELDQNEWMAKFQQKPFIREGLLFPADELRYYNGVLPEGDCRVVAAVDVAWGGGDSLSMPIGVEYENGDVFIKDWVFDRGPKENTLPKVETRITSNEIRQINFEANNGGDMYAQYIDDRLRERGYKCSTTHSKAPGVMAKAEKIAAYSGDIKRRFVFLEPSKRSPEYEAAMEELTMFVQIGRNPHDDAADSLAQLMRFIDGEGQLARVVAISRPF